MGGSVRLNLSGLDRLDLKTNSEIVVEMRQVLGPLVEKAGKQLVITTGTHRGDINLDFDSDTDTTGGKICSGGISILGEDAGETVFVKAHRDLRVCGPVDPVTHKQDTRRVLTAFWLLGPALANTGIHEIGHFVADLEHVNDPTNFMSILGPPKEKRTLKSQREFWAGKQHFTTDQENRLIKQLKEGKWLLDMSVTPVPSPP